MSIPSLIVAAVAFVLVALVVTTPFALVSRPRLERFAGRQGLPITVDNGPTVIKYLATTRRWRGSGLLVALVIATGYSSATSDEAHVNFLALFAGWFVGAVIAEWRVSSLAGRSRRAASLVPRRAADYISPRARLLSAALWVVLVAYEIVGLAVSASGSGGSWRLAIWLAATVASALVIGAVARHVLHRPQPLAAPDVLAADDAIRGRSLHVLAGSALAIGGYLASGAMASLSGYGTWMTDGPTGPLQVFCIVITPLLGLYVATLPEPARRRGDLRSAAERRAEA